MDLIRLEDVTVRFGNQTVLSRLNLTVRSRDTLVLLGESGCGKSVTLKLIVGLLEPTEGDVTFEGRSVRSLSDKEKTLLRLRVGFLFQQAALFDSLTVFENVAFGPRARGDKESEIRDLVHERLREVGLAEGVEVKMPAELSGGMRKRVGLARALALNPDVILYDEPTTGLDPVMTDVVNELILQSRQRRPITSVVVTHEMRTVEKVADRAAMLIPFSRIPPGGNQLIYDGDPKALTTADDPRVRQFATGDSRGHDALEENHVGS